MRGKDYNALQAKLDAGITPAYAGKSGDVDLEWVEKTGSPPPMRGKATIASLDIL